MASTVHRYLAHYGPHEDDAGSLFACAAHARAVADGEDARLGECQSGYVGATGGEICPGCENGWAPEGHDRAASAVLTAAERKLDQDESVPRVLVVKALMERLRVGPSLALKTLDRLSPVVRTTTSPEGN